MTLTETLVVAADHPSLDDRVRRFLAELRAERRFFGPSARCNPKPFPTLVNSLEERAGFRLARTEGERIVGLARVDPSGSLFVAVTVDRRGQGIGGSLLEASIQHAREHGHARLVMRTTRRSAAARSAAERIGCTVVDHDRGRIDLILPVHGGIASIGSA